MGKLDKELRVGAQAGDATKPEQSECITQTGNVQESAKQLEQLEGLKSRLVNLY